MNRKSFFRTLPVLFAFFVLVVSGIYYFSTNVKYESATDSVPIDILKTLSPGDIIMDDDSTLFCVKNYTQKAEVIICLSAYGKRFEIFLYSPRAKKIVKIIKKHNQSYCKTAKEFLSLY